MIDSVLQTLIDQKFLSDKYYSDSKQEYISIFDMQLHHFIRAFVLLQDTDATAIKNKLYEIKNLLEVA